MSAVHNSSLGKFFIRSGKPIALSFLVPSPTVGERSLHTASGSNPPMTRRIAQMLAVALLGVSAGSANADIYTDTFFSNSTTTNSYTGLADYTGSLTVNQNSAHTTATITLTLKNVTTPSNFGGYITAFALNNPNNSIITSITSFGSTNSAFYALAPGRTLTTSLPASITGANANGISTIFGNLDFGAGIYDVAGTANDWHGTDTPPANSWTVGIGVGNSATFTIGVTTSGILTADLLLGTFSEGSTASGKANTPLAVRFHGIDTDTSTYGQNIKTDKVPLDTSSVRPVPAPPAVVLGAVGALGLFGRRAWARRRTPELPV
jgi:hypothetical protein